MIKPQLIAKALSQKSTIYWIALGIIIKYITSGGYSFNNRLWDFERDMFNQITGRGFFSFLFFRDSAGYPIIPTRSAVWVIGSLFDSELWAIILHFLVILIQVFSFYLAIKLLPQYVSSTSRRFAFLILLLIPAEDINYIHHVGYLLLFPQLYLVRSLGESSIKKSIASIFLILFFLNKPINAILLIIYILVRFASKNVVKLRHVSLYFVVITSSSLYILLYLIFPRDLEMALLYPFESALQVITVLPYIASAIIIPSISIGLIGATRLISANSLLHIIGFAVTLILAMVMVQSTRRIKPLVKLIQKDERQKLLEILLMFLASYSLVFTIGDFYWVTVFPLWELSYPSHVWMRWSIVPGVFLVLLIISAIDLISQKSNFVLKIFSFSLAPNNLLLLGIVTQYILLWMLGYSYLQRWWG